jgi:hypothetical protein
MYRIFFAERDTTLYERYPTQNTGIDQILELTKIASGSKYFGVFQSNTYNSRILLDFGKEITTLSQSIVSNEIPPLGTGASSASVYLNLRAANANDLLHSYSIEAYPVSESWVNGNGNFSDSPIQTFGASWYYRDSEDLATTWNTASQGNSLGKTELEGGGSWITSSEATQTFENESPDIYMDVTNIVNGWITSSITNNGFIIKRSDSDEQSSEILGSLKFFGRESHTIFIPRLEVVWNNTTFTDTSSAEIASDTFVPYFKNIKSEYRRSEIAKFRIGVRPEFPNKQFQTSSFFLTGERLPTSSFYSIIDSVTDEILIPFDTKGTQIDCDVNGSFMQLRMDTFMPERFYKIMLKIERDGGNDIQTYDNFYFKVVK